MIAWSWRGYSAATEFDAVLYGDSHKYVWVFTYPSGERVESCADDGNDDRIGIVVAPSEYSALQTLASFVGAWIEAQRYPASENRELFPDALREWADAVGEMFGYETSDNE